jgi:hypothetical protein
VERGYLMALLTRGVAKLITGETIFVRWRSSHHGLITGPGYKRLNLEKDDENLS